MSDFGIFVGEIDEVTRTKDGEIFRSVDGEMFGYERNGHFRLVLNREKNPKVVVMPVSFGHPAATDGERSFAVRFVADSPAVSIRELPEVPRVDRALEQFCFGPRTSVRTKQGERKIVVDDEEGRQLYGEPRYRVFQVDCLANRGGIVFVYLCINRPILTQHNLDVDLKLSLRATCRGMMCRVESQLLEYETLQKVSCRVKEHIQR